MLLIFTLALCVCSKKTISAKSNGFSEHAPLTVREQSSESELDEDHWRSSSASSFAQNAAPPLLPQLRPVKDQILEFEVKKDSIQSSSGSVWWLKADLESKLGSTSVASSVTSEEDIEMDGAFGDLTPANRARKDTVAPRLTMLDELVDRHMRQQDDWHELNHAFRGDQLPRPLIYAKWGTYFNEIGKPFASLVVSDLNKVHRFVTKEVKHWSFARLQSIWEVEFVSPNRRFEDRHMEYIFLKFFHERPFRGRWVDICIQNGPHFKDCALLYRGLDGSQTFDWRGDIMFENAKGEVVAEYTGTNSSSRTLKVHDHEAETSLFLLAITLCEAYAVDSKASLLNDVQSASIESHSDSDSGGYGAQSRVSFGLCAAFVLYCFLASSVHP